MPDVETGARAPDFTLPSTDGSTSLTELLSSGHSVVLAFYTEDGTPSCQSEITILRDSQEMLAEFGARVIAVSADSVESHAAFAERVGGVPFPLASDVDLQVAREYGVVDAHDTRRSRRAVFVIDREGVVRLAIVPFQPANLAHVEAIFQALGAEN
jgi:peroxiredoxin Q/BCP